jgi:hypothetical protein
MGIMDIARRAAARPTYKELQQDRADLLSALGQSLDLSEVLLDCCDADPERKKEIRNNLDLARRGFNAYSSLPPATESKP